jgi:pimeloyl-ACP methyl ester carboxylesterase
MTSFVLVPGAMHGAWIWDRLTPLLEAAGHHVIAKDLPGSGADTSIALDEVTLEHWAQSVADSIRAAPPPVILVGHSRGGLVIGEAAELTAELLQGLIYITALIVPPGKSVFDLSEQAQSSPRSLRQSGGVLNAETAIAMFYNRCSSEDAAHAAAQLCLEPPRPIGTPSSVSWSRWGAVPRAYIECGDDRVISLERQARMQKEAPCEPVTRLDTDHSPFLSAPDALAAAMIDIAKRFENIATAE